MDYGWDASRQVFERILQLRQTQRLQLFDAFDRIVENSHHPLQTFSFELDGSVFYTYIVSRFVVTFTVDHPVSKIHILNVE